MGQAKIQRTNQVIKNSVGMTVVQHIENQINLLHKKQADNENKRFVELIQSGFLKEARNENEMESILV